MKLTHIALATAITATAGIANAETFFTNNSLTVLYGTDYKVGDSDKAVLTFEHYSAHSWGDIFVFGDRLMNQSMDGSETYIEVSPRFKVSNFDAGVIKNLYVATTWEMSETADNLLVGLGTDFNIPGFQNLSLNAYQRLNDNQEDNYQTTAVWGVPFAIAGQDFMFDGFWDWSTGTETYAASSNFTYQLKWDAAKALGTSNKVYVGIEHAIWDNKYNIKDGSTSPFGIADSNENAVSALVKVHF
jgi:nucleoside-specific outer membrane channel protein Tsx